MTRRRATAGIFCLLAGPALADTPVLERITLRDDLLGWEAVGRVDLGGGAFCTGTLVATDLVLTAAHCLFDAEADYARIDPGQIRFRSGLRDGESIADRTVTATIVPDAYRPGPSPTEGTVRNDLALLKLDAPIPAATAAPFAVASLPPASGSVAVVSYGADRAAALSIERACDVVGRVPGLLAFDCDVTFGSSGAPVFDLGQGRPQIVSVISAGHRGTDATTSYGAELPEVVAALRRAMDEGRGVDMTRAEMPELRPRLGGGTTEVRAGGARFLRP